MHFYSGLIPYTQEYWTMKIKGLTKYFLGFVATLLLGGAVAQEITVKGGGIEIPDETNSWSAETGTSFGVINAANGSVTRTFWILNTATSGPDLTVSTFDIRSGNGLGGNAYDTEFTIVDPSSLSIPAGDSVSFTVTFDPTAEGTYGAITNFFQRAWVRFTSNDIGTFNFAISGVGIDGTAFDCATGPLVQITNGINEYNFDYSTDPPTRALLGSTDNSGANLDGAGINPSDSLLYGIVYVATRRDELYAIGNDGDPTFVGYLTGDGVGSGSTQHHLAGTFDDQGYLYTFKNGLNDEFYRIDVRSQVSTQIDLSTSIRIRDMIYNPDDGLFYGYSYSGLDGLVSIDPNTGTVTLIGGNGDVLDHGIVRSASGEVYVMNINTDVLEQVDLTTGARRAMNSDPGFGNPGWMDLASCGDLSFPAQSKMLVKGNGLAIAHEDFTPNAEDGTDFGVQKENSGSLTSTFWIINEGNADLNITGNIEVRARIGTITVFDAHYNITQPSATTIAAGDSVSFTVEYAPTAAGWHGRNDNAGTGAAFVYIPTDDFDGQYDFDIHGTAISGDPFDCSSGLILLTSGGTSNLHRVDFTDIDLPISPALSTGLRHDGVGINPTDNLVYMMRRESNGNRNQMWVMGDDGVDQYVGDVIGFSASVVYAGGTFDDNGFYYTKPIGNNNQFYRVDVRSLESTEITLSQSIDIDDIGYRSQDGLFYAVSASGVVGMVSINPTTGQVTFLGNEASADVSGQSVLVSDDGNVFTQWSTGQIYQWDIVNGSHKRVSNDPTYNTSFMDGDACGTFTFAPTGIVVEGNSVEIKHADYTTSTLDDTYFGPALIGSGPIVRTFTISNPTTGTINIGTLTIENAFNNTSSDFSLTQPLSTTLTAGQSTTFTVSFTATLTALQEAIVSIPSDALAVGTHKFSVGAYGSSTGDFDTDDDGINDDLDLDDDNDGITDLDEGFCANSIAATVDSRDNSWTEIGPVTGGSSYEFISSGGSRTFTATNGPESGNTVHTVIYNTATANNLSKQISLKRYRYNGFNVYTATLTGTYQNPPLGWTGLPNDVGGAPVLGFIAFVDVNNNGVFDDGVDQYIRDINDLGLNPVNSGTLYMAFYDNGPYNDNNGTIQITATCVSQDYDNDGIPNHLDLDSDNDGCIDAQEGGDELSDAQVDMSDSTVLGAVDANGVPVLVGAGQTVKISQNENADAIACCTLDSDGDGLCDVIDLDDDDDGILDVDENCPQTIAGVPARSAFLFQRENAGDPMEIYAVDLRTGDTTFLAETSFYHNGLAYNDADGLFWGTRANNSNGNAISIDRIDPETWTVVGSLAYTPGTNVLSGAYDPVGKNYVIRRGVLSGQHQLRLYDADPTSPGYGTLKQAFNNNGGNSYPDIAYNALDSLMYGVNNTNGNLMSINLTTGARTDVGAIAGLEFGTSGDGYGAVYSTADGKFYLSNNRTGNIFLVDMAVDKNTAVLFSAGPSSSGNDGAKPLFVGVDGECFFDTDGDGDPDYLDLDSDNDGCIDVIEGDSTFSYAHVDPDSSLIGAVDTNGVPIIANGGQGIGSSQDSLVNACCPGLVITNPAAVCAPATVDLTAPAIYAGSADTSGAVWRYWSNAAATIPVLDSTSVGAGTYYVTVLRGGCEDTAAIVVTVNTRPNLVITNPSAACAPATIDLTASIVTSGSTNMGTLTYFSDSLATSPYLFETSATTGRYFIVATSNGCTDTAGVTATVNVTPDLSITQPSAVCFPATIDLAGTVGGTNLGTNSYYVNANGTGSVADETIVGDGTYYVVSLTGAGCSDTAQINAVVNDKPDLLITNPDAVCEGSAVDLTQSSITSGSTNAGALAYWLDANATNPVTDETAVDSGSYFIVTVNGNNCSDTAEVMATVNLSPNFTVSGNNPTACATATGDFTIEGLAINTDYFVAYNGSDDTLFTSNGSGQITVGDLVAGGYTNVTVTSIPEGCSDTDAGVTLSDPGAPSVDAGLPQFICEGESVTLTATNPDGAVITWDNSVDDGVSFTPTGTLTYTATATLAGCVSSDDVTVTMNPSPNVVITQPTAVCDPERVDLNATVGGTNLGTNTFYTDANATSVYGTPAAADSGTYYVISVSDSSCSSDTLQIDVVVNPKPDLVVNDPAPVCAPDVVNLITPDLTAGSTNLGTSPALSFFVDSLATVPYSSLSDADSGRYWLVVETLEGCTDTAAFNVVVNTLPVFDVEIVDASSCGASDGGIRVSGLIVGSDYTVSFDGGTDSTYTADALGQLIYGGLGAGSYSNITVTKLPEGCSTTTDPSGLTLNDPGAPTVDAGLPQVICEGEEVILHASNPDTANISWSNGVLDSVVFTPGVGSILYTVTAEKAGCISTDTVRVTVNVQPTVDAGLIQVVCEGAVVTLTASNPDNVALNWDNGVVDGVPFTPGVGSVLYTVSADTNGCSDSDSVRVTVNTQPELVGTDINALCSPETANLLNQVSGVEVGVIEYYSDASLSTEVTDASQVGTGTYYIYNEAQGGCSDTVAVQVTVNAKPDLIAAAPSVTCDTLLDLTGSDITIGSTLEGAAITYYSDAALTTPVADSVAVVSGTYYLVAETLAGCSDTTAIAVNLGGPEINVRGNQTDIIDGQTITSFTDSTDFGDQEINKDSLTNTYWIINEGQCDLTIDLIQSDNIEFSSETLDTTLAAGDSVSFTITFGPVTTGYQTSNIIIVNNDADEDPYNYVVSGNGTQDLPDIHIYDGFSPDDNGDNDVWWIDNISYYPDNEILIYNRWGNLVWKGTGYDNVKVVWKGEANQGIVVGDRLPDGTYFYIVDYVDQDGETQTEDGYVVIATNR